MFPKIPSFRILTTFFRYFYNSRMFIWHCIWYCKETDVYPSCCWFLPYINDDANRPHIERSVVSFIKQDLGGEVGWSPDHRTTERFLFDYPSKTEVAEFDLLKRTESSECVTTTWWKAEPGTLLLNNQMTPFPFYFFSFCYTTTRQCKQKSVLLA